MRVLAIWNVIAFTPQGHHSLAGQTRNVKLQAPRRQLCSSESQCCGSSIDEMRPSAGDNELSFKLPLSEAGLRRAAEQFLHPRPGE
jgi:hypothetical protein